MVNEGGGGLPHENEPSDSDGDVADRPYHQRRHHGRPPPPRRASSTRSQVEDARDRWELERTRRALEALRAVNARARDEEPRLVLPSRGEAERQRAERELDEFRRRQAAAAYEKRVRDKVELEAREKQRREAEEQVGGPPACSCWRC